MPDTQLCDHCHEPLTEKRISRGSKVYCCEACAFEATRSVDCSGRSDSHVSQPAGKDKPPAN